MLVLSLLTAILAMDGWTQMVSPLLGEYTPGGVRPGDQTFPALALNPNGGWLAWQDNGIDGPRNGVGIAAVKLDGQFVAGTNVFRVNRALPGNQEKPQVLSLANGNALFLWQSGTASRQHVFARLMGTNNVFRTVDLQVSTPGSTNRVTYVTTNWYGFTKGKWGRKRYRLVDRIQTIRENNSLASGVALPNGGAAVVFQSHRRNVTNSWALVREEYWNGRGVITNDVLRASRSADDSMQEIYLQRLGTDGRKAGQEILINRSTRWNQRNPGIARLANSNLVVTWVSERPVSPNPLTNVVVEIVARLCDPQGQPFGDEILVSTAENHPVANPVVAALADGGFLVAWSQAASVTGRSWDVFGRAFAPDGAASGDAYLVNGTTTGSQFAPKIASSGEAQMVVWTSLGQDGSREGIYARLLNSGQPVGSEFRVNTTTRSSQFHPAVAADGTGRFLAVWSGFTGASFFDLMAQRYAEATPALTSTAPGGFGLVATQQTGNFGSAPPAGGGSGIFEAAGQTAPPLRTRLDGPPGKLRLTWSAQAGAAYQVQVSVDLKAWVNLGAPRAAAGVSDSVGIEDNLPAAFYRVVQLP